MLILSVKVFTDLVQIFHININRILFKSSIFAWGIPLFIEICYRLFENCISHGKYIADVLVETVILIILLINFILYVKVVYSLTKFNALNSKESRCRKIKIATLTFFICGIPWLIAFILDYLTLFLEYSDVTSNIFAIDSLVFSAQNIIFKLYFCLLKSNTELWSEFFERRRRTRRVVVEVGVITFKSKEVFVGDEFEVTHL